MELRKFIKTTIREYLNEQTFYNMILEVNADEIKSKYYPNIKQDVFNKIVSSDKITSNIEKGKVGKYAKWLLKLYLNNELELDDLSKAEEYIYIFNKLSNAGKLNNRDINNYKSLNDIYIIISNYHNTNKSISKSDKVKKIKNQNKLIYIDDRFIVIEPLTKQASCYYGKGTKWCTSGDYIDNKFDEYITRGSLYIIIDKSNRNTLGDYVKYKIHFQDGEYKDDNNKEIDFDVNPEIKNVVKKIIKELNINPVDLVNFRASNIMFIDNPSEEVQLNAVKTPQHAYVIKYIDNPTEKVQMYVVKKDGTLIKYIDNPSYEVQNVAIKQNPTSIKYINQSEEDKKYDEIKHYEELLKSGYITQYEFNQFIKKIK
jgi:hypothetical protein